MESAEDLLFRMGETATCSYDCGKSPGENGKLRKQEKEGAGVLVVDTVGQERPLQAQQLLRDPSSGPLVAGSFYFRLCIKSSGELFKK